MPRIPKQAKPGWLISFDGVDSSGKETQSKILSDRLRFNGHIVHNFQSPDYATPSGQKLKRLLQNEQGEWLKIPWPDKMKYFSDNRAEHRAAVVAALGRGEIVVYDRYVPSSLAFIAVEALKAQEIDLFRRELHQTIRQEEYQKNGMPQEHVSIFLDVPPRISAQLLERRQEKLRHAAEYTDHLALQERLYNEYDFLSKEYPNRFLRIACLDGNELLPVDATSELVWEGLLARLPALKLPPVQSSPAADVAT